MQMKTVDGEGQFLIGVFIKRQIKIINRHLFKNCFQMVNQKLLNQ